MYIFFIILILLASILLIFTVLAQNPKSGMAANFGASNQVMGARKTSDMLEKLTWGLAIAILLFSLAATMTIKISNNTTKDAFEKALENNTSQDGTGDYINSLEDFMGGSDVIQDEATTEPAAEPTDQ